jgi:hypothetical protein
MDEFLRLHGVAIVYVIGGFSVFLLSILGWFLRNDRKSFMDSLKTLDDKIKECKNEIDSRIDGIMEDVESIKGNYNTKFQKVYDKQDEQVQVTNENHIELLKAIQQVELKIK